MIQETNNIFDPELQAQQDKVLAINQKTVLVKKKKKKKKIKQNGIYLSSTPAVEMTILKRKDRNQQIKEDYEDVRNVHIDGTTYQDIIKRAKRLPRVPPQILQVKAEKLMEEESNKSEEQQPQLLYHRQAITTFHTKNRPRKLLFEYDEQQINLGHQNILDDQYAQVQKKVVPVVRAATYDQRMLKLLRQKYLEEEEQSLQ